MSLMVRLKDIFLLLFFQIITSALVAQRIIDSIPVCSLPVRDGIIYQYNRDAFRGCMGSGDFGVSILTKCDSVFHFEDGKVVAVHYYGHDEDGGYAIVIRNQKDEFISYSNLKYVALKKGDIVKRGAWLGLTGISEDGAERQVDFIFIKNKRQLPFKRAAEYIRCNISCELKKGYTL